MSNAPLRAADKLGLREDTKRWWKEAVPAAADLWGMFSGAKAAKKRACLCERILRRKQAYEELMVKLGSGAPMTPWDNEALRFLDSQRKADALTAYALGLEYSVDLYSSFATNPGWRGLPMAAAEAAAATGASPAGYDDLPHAPGRGNWTVPTQDECEE